MEKHIKSSINEILTDKYLSYAISTIISRSLPDVRDGLKPVHRRIIYSMHLLKLNHNSSFKKSARIVGDVMGKFHPHGDQAIYDSLVRLAQDFVSRVPLIEGQGNFGNVDGDNAAAMRYTEARLGSISNYFFDGIDEDAVDFKENYDGQNLEPSVLPTKLPNILMNGASGIAVGMATNIPPHNLLELNNAIIKLIKQPSIILSSLLKDFLGPDFPTGGEIMMNNKEKMEIYKKGKGSFIIRSIWKKELLKNGLYQIIITEIPYQVNKTRLIEQLANLINNKKIPLDDVLDESDEKIRIVLKPKNRNIDPEKLIELCFKLSDLSTKYSCNFNVLENGISPKQIGLKEILNNFINHRRKTIKRKSLFNKEKISKRLKILEGYLIAYKNLDSIIKIIRRKDEPKKELMKKFRLTDIQAEAILNMRLGSLKKLDEVSTKKEIKELKEEFSYLNKLIKNKNILDKYLISELLKINKEIDEKTLVRRSKVISKFSTDIEINFNEFQEIEKMTVILLKDGSLKVFRDHLEDSKIKNTNNLNSYEKILSNQKILLFVSSGRVYTVDPNKLPSGKSNPKNFIFFVESASNEKLIAMLQYKEDLKCIVASKFGKGFIADLNEIQTSQKKGKRLFNLKSGDQLIKVTDKVDTHIACIAKNSKLLIFKTNELPELKKGGGVQLQKIKKDEFLSDIQTFNLNEGIVWQKGSQVKRESKVNFWLGKRSQSGKKVPKKFNKNLKFNE